jgi:hypothetical protein
LLCEFRLRARPLVYVLIGMAITGTAVAGPLDFPEVHREAKPWTRWWWLGSAVDKPNLTRSLEEFEAAGLGGVEITPIYGVKGQEHRHIDYLTTAWLDMLAHTTGEADRLGLGVDMPTGTGWPFGGPGVALEDADMKVSVARVDIDGVGDSLGLPKGARLLCLMAYETDGSIADRTGSVEDGRFAGPLSPAGTTYYAVSYRFSGRKVKRPAPGGAGMSVNTYAVEGLGKYLEQFGDSMKGYAGKPLRAHFHDSFEYSGNWTPGLWEDFEGQHGYDLRRHLPAMLGEGDPDTVARIKSDYRETLAALLLEAFTQQWTEWAHGQEALTRNQAHGSPGNLIDLYATVDIPETEIFGPSGFPIPGLCKDPSFENEPPDLLMLKFASSGAHLSGKRLVSSETCTWLGEHFQVALSQAKPEVDQLFAAGINHTFYHGTPYSPEDAAWPGWLFYASVHFGPTNPWWDDFQYLNAYIGRCQALLQGSAPANDVLLYFPLHDIWHDEKGLQKQLTVHNIDDWLVGTPFYDLAEQLTAQGFAFDYVSDALLDDAAVADGRIKLGEGKYRVVIIPETARMPHTTLRRLLEIAGEGGKVVFMGELPSDVPGFGTLDARRAEMNSIVNSWNTAAAASTDQVEVSFGTGNVVTGQPLGTTLASLQLAPETLATSGLSMIRRRHAEGYLYFVANLTANTVDEFWPLATPAASVVWMDPLGATSGIAETKSRDDGQTQVRIALKAGESCFLRTYTERRISGTPWPYWNELSPVIPIEGSWSVEFIKGGPEIPKAYRLNQLDSWTNAPDKESKRFAGTARYEITFDAPDAGGSAWRIDLGKVLDSARVTLNGTVVGCAWSFPYELVLREPLRPTGNLLSIEVTNLAANRIADMDRRKVPWKIFHDTNVVNIQYKPFDASAWPLMNSGLLGPVRLVPLGQ